MKTCKKCGRALPETEFGVTSIRGKVHQRNVCRGCDNERRRKKPAAIEPDPTPPSANPLADAYQAHEADRYKRDLSKEHKALLEENTALRAQLSEAARLNRPLEIIVYDKAKEERADAIACAVGSDWHVEEPVEAASVHNLNAYNLEIAKSRAEHFFKNLLRLTDIAARDSKVTTIWLGLLGDFFSGWIHEELIANALLAPGDAALFVKALLCSGIDFLLRESSYIIEGDCLPGNHGRMTKQMHFGNPTGTSLETVMYHHVADRYAGNPRVRLNVSSQAMVYRSFFESFSMRLIHGYEVKYGGGVGGLTIPLNKAIAQWDIAKRADLTVFGHFHQLIQGPRICGNGSMIGYNLFAQAIKASYEEAQQAFFLVSARKGGQRSLTAPIWLDTEKKPTITLDKYAGVYTGPF